MIQREPSSYTRELLKSTFPFDGRENEYNMALIEMFNRWIIDREEFKNLKLRLPKPAYEPDQIIWVDASSDGLPATSESRRVCGGIGTVVNTREELAETLSSHPNSSLIMSQCVKKECYDTVFCSIIETAGSVCSPGTLTAPGALFSDKAKTYDLLSEHGKRWDIITHYVIPRTSGENPETTAKMILDCVEAETGTDSFFVKPTEGGGGLGGFRLVKIRRKDSIKFVIPDLSHVSGEFGTPHSVPLTVDPDNENVIEELWWLYNRFCAVTELRKNYIDVRLESKSDIRKLLKRTGFKKSFSRDEAERELSAAIEKFQNKFNKRYTPIVCHYMDFGTWGMRAHYRMTSDGIKIEALYGRIFQIRFSEEGIGYVGADNISNKHTGELELGRLVPINRIMAAAIGGESRLNYILLKGANAVKMLLETLPENLIDKVPLRAQMDIAAVSGLIGEGNADTARGFCIAQNWNSFTENIRDWLKDSLRYYSYIKSIRREI